MMIHSDLQLPLAHALIDEHLAHVERERLGHHARQAAHNFIPVSRWRDRAFWASLVGPIFTVSFLGYFAQEIGRAALS